jgi:hypothetical protein
MGQARAAQAAREHQVALARAAAARERREAEAARNNGPLAQPPPTPDTKGSIPVGTQTGDASPASPKSDDVPMGPIEAPRLDIGKHLQRRSFLLESGLMEGDPIILQIDADIAAERARRRANLDPSQRAGEARRHLEKCQAAVKRHQANVEASEAKLREVQAVVQREREALDVAIAAAAEAEAASARASAMAIAARANLRMPAGDPGFLLASLQQGKLPVSPEIDMALATLLTLLQEAVETGVAATPQVTKTPPHDPGLDPSPGDATPVGEGADRARSRSPRGSPAHGGAGGFVGPSEHVSAS